MTSKAAPEPEEWVSVTRESEDGGLAKRDMQDVTLNDDVEAAPAPSTGAKSAVASVRSCAPSSRPRSTSGDSSRVRSRPPARYRRRRCS